MIKKTLLLFVFICVIFQGQAQIKFSFAQFINGYWGEWSNSYQYQSYNNTYLVHYYFKGTYTDFIVFKSSNHPSNYIARVAISNEEAVNKILFSTDKTFAQARKKALKENTWYEFDGYIEYYALDGESFIKSFPSTVSSADDKHKRKREAVTIRIHPFKKKPSFYNIFFKESDGNVGLGLQI